MPCHLTLSTLFQEARTNVAILYRGLCDPDLVEVLYGQDRAGGTTVVLTAIELRAVFNILGLVVSGALAETLSARWLRD